MAEVHQQIDVAARPEVGTGRRTEDRYLVEPVPARQALLLATRWRRQRVVQPSERPRPGPRTLANGKRLLDVPLEQVRAREPGAEGAPALDVLDRRAEQLRGRALSNRDARHATDRLAYADQRSGLGAWIDEQMERACVRVESGELDRRAAHGGDAQDLLRPELELRALELELRPPGRVQRVARAGGRHDAVGDQAHQRLAHGAVIGRERRGALAQRQAVGRSRRDGYERAEVEVALARGRHDQNDTYYLQPNGQDGGTPTLGQRSRSTHCEQSGRRATHTARPWRMSPMCSAYTSSSGT